jgi:PhnB protein
METKDILPEGANWLTPYLTVSNPELSLTFYEKAFGFGRGDTIPGPDGRIMYAEMTWQKKTIVMFAPEGAGGSTHQTPRHSGVESPIGLYVYCADVDALVVRARQAHALVLSEPEDMFWGDRMARLQDPDGYIWSFATKVGEFDPSRIPAE